MLVFLGKFENLGKTKSINLLYFSMVLGVRCDDIFKLIARAQSVNNESLCTELC